MNSRRPAMCLIAALALVAAGCAASPGPGVTVAGETPLAEGAAPAAPAYQLTPEEQALDCKKLTGRMQVRILQERDYAYRRRTSATAREMKSVTNSVFGGSTHGADPDADHAKAVAQLEAYNARLAGKGCQTFDLAKELEPKPITATPTPVPKPDKTKPGKPD